MEVYIQSGSEMKIEDKVAMYELRYRVCVEMFGWELPLAKNGLEKDQFDYPDTVYVVIKHNAKIVAAVRLNQTIQPHLMSEIFPKYCEFGTVPVGIDILEMSRYVIDTKALNRRHLLVCMGYLEYYVTKYCLSQEVKQVSWLTTMDVYRKTISLWPTKPLGVSRPGTKIGEDFIAAISKVETASLQKIIDRYKLSEWISKKPQIIEAA